MRQPLGLLHDEEFVRLGGADTLGEAPREVFVAGRGAEVTGGRHDFPRLWGNPAAHVTSDGARFQPGASAVR